MLRHWLVLTLLIGLATGARAACESDRTHVTQPGEDLFYLAEEYYGDRDKWSVIYNANADALAGISPTFVPRGIRLRIPCIDQVVERETPPPSGPVAPVDEARPSGQRADIVLLTGGDYAPFTDRGLPEDGLVTEIVRAAFDVAPYRLDFEVLWNDDWSAHFDLLESGEYDAGFPWLRPNCEEDPANRRCRRFLFSEPVYEMLVMLFVRRDDPIGFTTDEAIAGKRVCRPRGYFTHDLDSNDRRWIRDGVIDFVRGDSPSDCFERLVRGSVDAVTVNEFLGRSVIDELGIGDEVMVEPRPVSVEGLHVIFPKNHWRATTMKYRFDEGVVRLREQLRYAQIVDRHMSLFWSGMAEDDAPPAGKDAGEQYRTEAERRERERAESERRERERAEAERRGRERAEAEEADGADVADIERVRERFDSTFFIYTQTEILAPAERDYKLLKVSGTGTGFLLTPDIVVTNAHVVGDAQSVLVANRANGTMLAEVLDATPLFDTGGPDFAILRLPRAAEVTPMILGSSMRIFDEVFALGFPGLLLRGDSGYHRFLRGSEEDLPTLSASKGAIQARLRNTANVDVVLHDSEISQGNSGGPLLDGCGRVVGINTYARLDTNRTAAQYEMAISATEIRAYLQQNGIDVEMRQTPCLAR